MRFAIFCCVTDRKMRIDQDTARYFEIGDREDLSYGEKLGEYRKLADDFFEKERYDEFCGKHLQGIDEAMVDFIESSEFDNILVDTVRTTFPAHEHDEFIAHYRGLLGAWASDQQ